MKTKAISPAQTLHNNSTTDAKIMKWLKYLGQNSEA
jgi:hypothetical protein